MLSISKSPFFLLLSFTLIYGVYHQCLFNTCQEESSGNGINRRYKNSCLYWEDFTLDFETLKNYTNKKYEKTKNFTSAAPNSPHAPSPAAAAAAAACAPPRPGADPRPPRASAFRAWPAAGSRAPLAARLCKN